MTRPCRMPQLLLKGQGCTSVNGEIFVQFITPCSLKMTEWNFIEKWCIAYQVKTLKFGSSNLFAEHNPKLFTDFCVKIAMKINKCWNSFQVHPTEVGKGHCTRKGNGVHRNTYSSVQLDDWCLWKLRHTEVLWVWYIRTEADSGSETPRACFTTSFTDVWVPGHPESFGIHSSRYAGEMFWGFFYIKKLSFFLVIVRIYEICL